MKRKLFITLPLFFLQMALCPMKAQKLDISKTTIDCGRTGYRMPITATFELKNNGSRNMTIVDVKTDCGCTKIRLPKKSLAPGEKFEMKMTYDARMLGHFEKQAAIHYTGADKPMYVKMKGVVLAEWEDYSGNYPYTIGLLMCDRNQLEFDNVNKGDQPEIVVNVMNNSSEALQPNLMHLPDCLTAEIVPETLKSGQKGKITIKLNSAKLHDMGLTQTSVYLSSKVGDKVNPEIEMPVSVVLLPDMSTFDGAGKKLAPTIKLSADHLDMGMVEGKHIKTGYITVTNTGKSLLKISSLQMFTAGLSLTLDKRELEPGEETKLRVSANRSTLLKAKQKPRILMITNDPDHAKMVININVK